MSTTLIVACACGGGDSATTADGDGDSAEYCAFSIALDPGVAWTDDQWQGLVDLAPDIIRADVATVAETMAGTDPADVSDVITDEVIEAAENVSAWETRNCAILATDDSAPTAPATVEPAP